MAAYAQVPPDTTAVFGLDSIVVASTIRTNGIRGDVAKNVKGNVSSAIGYWAGYGIDIKELIFE